MPNHTTFAYQHYTLSSSRMRQTKTLIYRRRVDLRPRNEVITQLIAKRSLNVMLRVHMYDSRRKLSDDLFPNGLYVYEAGVILNVTVVLLLL